MHQLRTDTTQPLRQPAPLSAHVRVPGDEEKVWLAGVDVGRKPLVWSGGFLERAGLARFELQALEGSAEESVRAAVSSAKASRLTDMPACWAWIASPPRTPAGVRCNSGFT